MTGTNEDWLEAKEYFEYGQHTFSIRHFSQKLIQEVARLREEIESNKFVDEMNELADMLECFDTKEKIVTESGIRNAVKNKIDSLTKERDVLRKAMNELRQRKPSDKIDAIKKLEAENADLKQKLEAAEKETEDAWILGYDQGLLEARDEI